MAVTEQPDKLVVTQEAEAFAKSILWVSTLIDDEEAIAQAFQRAMNASAEAEREACARVAEEKFADRGWDAPYRNAGLSIATAIRALDPAAIAREAGERA